MVVLVVERVPTSLRGELTRWMIEPRTGVFVGTMSARVRDKLWEKATKSVGHGGATMIYKTNTEQGYALRNWGDTSRQIVDLDGIVLPVVPSAEDSSDNTTAGC